MSTTFPEKEAQILVVRWHKKKQQRNKGIEHPHPVVINVAMAKLSILI